MNKSVSLAKLRTLAVQGHRANCIRAFGNATLTDAERMRAVEESERALTRNLDHIDRSEARESIYRPDVLALDMETHSSSHVDIQTRLILDARHVF